MGRAERLTAQLADHDRELYCDRNEEGKLCIYRKSVRWEKYHLNDDDVLLFARPAPHFIFALTHNCKPDGTPVEWGILAIIDRLRKMDLWRRDIAGEVIKEEERRKASEERARINENESFLLEFRKQFARAFDGVNVSNLEKKPLKTY